MPPPPPPGAGARGDDRGVAHARDEPLRDEVEALLVGVEPVVEQPGIPLAEQLAAVDHREGRVVADGGDVGEDLAGAVKVSAPRSLSRSRRAACITTSTGGTSEAGDEGGGRVPPGGHGSEDARRRLGRVVIRW